MEQDEGSGSATVESYEERRKGVRRLRKQLGLFQRGLAQLAHVDRGTICRFESGAKNIKEATLTAIEEALSDQLAAQKIATSARGQRAETNTSGGLAGLAQAPLPPLNLASNVPPVCLCAPEFEQYGRIAMHALLNSNPIYLREENEQLS